MVCGWSNVNDVSFTGIPDDLGKQADRWERQDLDTSRLMQETNHPTMSLALYE